MAVIGASPVTFISEDEVGVQVQIPLSALSVENGTVKLDPGWKPHLPGNALGANDSNVVKALLASLLARGLISAPPS